MATGTETKIERMRVVQTAEAAAAVWRLSRIRRVGTGAPGTFTMADISVTAEGLAG